MPISQCEYLASTSGMSGFHGALEYIRKIWDKIEDVLIAKKLSCAFYLNRRWNNSLIKFKNNSSVFCEDIDPCNNIFESFLARLNKNQLATGPFVVIVIWLLFPLCFSCVCTVFSAMTEWTLWRLSSAAFMTGCTDVKPGSVDSFKTLLFLASFRNGHHICEMDVSHEVGQIASF